jgi:hypothetical protein
MAIFAAGVPPIQTAPAEIKLALPLIMMNQRAGILAAAS